VHFNTTLAGSYPKLPTQTGEVNLRVVLNRRDQGKASDQDVANAVRETTRRVIAIGERAGLDILMDGSAGWEDAQTYVARGLDGFRIAGLIRYLDTNTYYRQPEIIGPVSWTKPITVADYQAAAGMTKKPVKAFLPGPYSLYRFSKDLHYGDPVRAGAAIGEALAREAEALEAAGAAWIHFEEPWLGRARAEDADAVRAALAPALSGRKARTVVHVPFRAPSAIFPTLRDLPWAAIGLDLVESPAGWDLLSQVPKGRTVALGLVDARNTMLEQSANVAKLAARAAHARSDLEFQITPTASLEYLPADKAEAKVERLVEAARMASRNGGSR
jgi:5-methyltetrahydropteroyltriglutamate--homocysteine methyltransferase